MAVEFGTKCTACKCKNATTKNYLTDQVKNMLTRNVSANHHCPVTDDFTLMAVL